MKKLVIVLSLTLSSPAFAGPLCDATYGPEECARMRQRFLRNLPNTIAGIAAGAAQGMQAGRVYDAAPKPSMTCQISQWKTDVWGRPVLECN